MRGSRGHNTHCRRPLRVVVEQGCTPVAREVDTGTAHQLSVLADGSPLRQVIECCEGNPVFFRKLLEHVRGVQYMLADTQVGAPQPWKATAKARAEARWVFEVPFGILEPILSRPAGWQCPMPPNCAPSDGWW